MKKFVKLSIVFISIVLTMLSCQSNDKKLPVDLVRNPKSASGTEVLDMPEITFQNVDHDFGRLIQGERVSYSFKFTNTGNADLILIKVSASCGCTASKYTKEPIAAGKEGKIEVTFDSNGQKGIVNKTITVLSNSQTKTIVLRIKAQVITPESY